MDRVNPIKKFKNSTLYYRRIRNRVKESNKQRNEILRRLLNAQEKTVHKTEQVLSSDIHENVHNTHIAKNN